MQATELLDVFTSTGAKLASHPEVMKNLREGKPQAVTCHVMPTDHCQASCSFCSVSHRPGDVLTLDDICGFLDILLKHGLRSCVVSGGGNPILYRCPKTGADFNMLISEIHSRGLEIGLITNGMTMKEYPGGRKSWKTVKPETLDKCTWIRISMAGLDHEERCVYVPDIDRSKTTLGMSYVLADIYFDAAEPNHGKVSRPEDLITTDPAKRPAPWYATDRLPELTEQIRQYVEEYRPQYVRLLPDCTVPSKIAERCDQLREMANAIDPTILFCQEKPPRSPNVCLLGIIHPVLNCDGYVYPCDSCVLNESAGHKFGVSWRIGHWSEIGKLYEQPVHSLIKDPHKQCPGCVFNRSNSILEKVWKGELELRQPEAEPLHTNFV